MRRIALLSLTTLIGGCGYNTWWNAPFTTGYNPNVPIEDSLNMRRAMGEGVAVKPLAPEPGNIWPGPLPPPRTLQDLERRNSSLPLPGAPVKGAPSTRGANPLLAPMPAGPGQAPLPAQRVGRPADAPAGDKRIIVPNGNGTSTVIHPDGRIETIPTPK